jgi:hypothetical protein
MSSLLTKKQDKIMIAKEKAKELVENYCHKISLFSSLEIHYIELAKQSALIAVDEISKVVNDIWMDSFTTGESDNKFYNYWQEVKNEIEKL